MKILVSNAATHPAPKHLAAGLQKRGHEVTYVTALAFTFRSRNVVDHLPAKLAIQVSRRVLPAGIVRTISAAPTRDLLRVATEKTALGGRAAHRRLSASTWASVERRALRSVQKGGG